MTDTHSPSDTSAVFSNSTLNTYRGSTILITGGRGYIGSALAQTFAGVNCKLILLDQSPEGLWKPAPQIAEVLVLSGDVSLRETWEKTLPGVDHVFHLAAEEYFYRSDYNPERDYQFNAQPILRLLETCRVQNYRPKIVFSSSANLFGLVDTLPVNEDSCDDPLTMWAVHKLAAEYYLRLYAQQFGINSISLRLANVYGPAARWSVMDRVVINKVINMALAGETLTTYTNQSCVRDYVFLDDVVSAFIVAGACCDSTRSPIFVIGSGEGKSIADVWQLIADCVRVHTGKVVAIRFDDSVKIEPLELRSFVADTGLFQNATGWKPRMELAQGIDITVRALFIKIREVVMKVLIIGGAGFLGSNLVRRCLAEKSCQITVLDSLEPLGHPTTQNLKEVWSKIRFIRGDIRNETLLAEIVQDQDIIFNCAAQTSHALSIQYPLLDADINCMGSLKLLEAVRLLNKDAVVVYSSSSTVIGKALNEIADEDHPERPLEIYSANKGVAEKYYRIYHSHYDLKTVVLRFANLYGPFGKGFSEFGFINYFIYLSWTNQFIKIFGGGDQTRNVMFVDDATDILWQAAHEPGLIGETYLATATQHMTVREIAETIVSVFGRGKVMHVDWPDERRRIEIGDARLSSARLRAKTGWEPRHDFVSGLQRTKAVLESNGV